MITASGGVVRVGRNSCNPLTLFLLHTENLSTQKSRSRDMDAFDESVDNPAAATLDTDEFAT